jgi:hypothetical protein
MVLLKVLFLETRLFSRVKTQELRSSDDNICALFFVWRRRFLKTRLAVRVLFLVVVSVTNASVASL